MQGCCGDFFEHFFKDRLGKFQAFVDDRFDEIIERLDKVLPDGFNPSKDGQHKVLLEDGDFEHGKVGVGDHLNDFLAVPVLLKQTQANRQDLIVIGLDLEALVENAIEQLHDPQLLFLEQGVVGNPNDRSHYLQDVLFHQLSGCTPDQELNHVQAFLHNLLLAVGDALDQDGDVVLEDLFIVPDVLIVAGELVFKRHGHLLDILCCFVALAVRDDKQVNLMAEGAEFVILEEDQGTNLTDDDVEVIDFFERSRVQEENYHIHEDLEDILLLGILSLFVDLDAPCDVRVDHLDELRLVLRTELQGYLFKAIDDQAEPVFLGLVIHKRVNFIDQDLSSWPLKVRIKIVSQSFRVVCDSFDLELRHRSLHDLVDHSIHYLVRVGIQQVLEQVEVISVVRTGLIRMVHLRDHWVEQILKETLFVQLLNIEGQTFSQGWPHILGYHEQIICKQATDQLLVGLFGQKLIIEPLDKLSQHFEDSHLMLSFLEVVREVVQNLSEIVFTVFGGECDDVLEDDSSGGVGPLGPHLDQFLDTCLDGLGRVFDVGVPDLVGSEARHFQVIVLHDINCHETSVVGVGLFAASSVVHMAFDDVQNLADQDYSCVSLLPVVIESPVAQRLQQQVSMTQAVVVDQHLLDQHCRVSDHFVLVRHKTVHILVDLLNEPFELLRLYRRNEQEDQDVPFLL